MTDFYDEAAASGPPGASQAGELGPVFMATWTSESTCCGEDIKPGEDARADGYGGWIHADTQCEMISVLGHAGAVVTGRACPECFTIHGSGQKGCER